MTRKLTLSVRDLVAFACRSGDLAAGPRGPSSTEGIRAHQRWQRKRGASYRAEVTVKATFTVSSIDQPILDDYEVTLQGRIDLLCETGPLPLVEEIKSCYFAPEHLPEAQKALHWAQLNVYGYLYLHNRQLAADALAAGDQKVSPGKRLSPAETVSSGKQASLDDQLLPDSNTVPGDDASATQLTLCMTWYSIPQDRGYEEKRSANLAELQQFTNEALQRYVDWQQQVDAQQRASQMTAQALAFPFPAFRAGQRAMAAQIYRTLRDRNALLCEAPTGIGKTISALFPAIKALGQDHLDQILYLTAKNSGRQTATQTLVAMTEQGLDISYLVIQAKKHACHCSNGSCSRDEQGVCPRCPGFFDRLPEARKALLQKRHMDSATIDAIAHQYQLCPFELSLQMLPWSTVVICDYNYAFDPLVALSGFRDKRLRCAVLVDEAHNLIDRSRQMYSARLERHQLRRCASLGESAHPALARGLKAIDRALGRWHQQCTKNSRLLAGAARGQQEAYVNHELPVTVVKAVQRFAEIQASQPADSPPYPVELADYLRDIHRFNTIADRFEVHHRTLSRQRPQGRTSNIELDLQCLNASAYLADSYQDFHAIALFSATLRPLDFYRRALGLDQQCASLALPSPFLPEQQATLVCSDIDTRYRQREQAIPGIVELIECVFSSKPGNYLLFFASYRFMVQVADAVTERYPALDILVQQRQADEPLRASFLASFSAHSKTLGFAIMGGVFGEGVDYLGDKLIGAMVVGTGLPGIDTKQELIRQDYQDSGLNGFDFAYRFPGLSRVLQAAGRVIRSESDRGVVVLVDQRFATPAYRKLMPAHWQLQYCDGPASVTTTLRAFWQHELLRQQAEAIGPLQQLDCPPPHS
jgi:DNA excision repair protein ERCC-2